MALPEASGDPIGDTAQYLTKWSSQAFTPTETFTVSKVIPRLLKRGTPPSSGRFRIKLADGNHEPTGEELTFGLYDPTELTEDADGEWKEITVVPIQLASGIEYCLESSGQGTGYWDGVGWVEMLGDPLGANTEKYTDDGGATWQTFPGTNAQLKMEATAGVKVQGYIL